MATDSRVSTSPPLVAIAAWLVPGSGYLLIGQRGRAMGVGFTIIILFVLGLLIGGIRVIEVPGYDSQTGEKVMYPVTMQRIDPESGRPRMYNRVDPVTKKPLKQWAMIAAPLNEIRDKPWSVPQAIAGPMAILAGAASVYSTSPDAAAPGGTVAALSHARINEIGSLYLSVAGLLNLLAIIDSTWRASQINEEQSDAGATA